MKFRNLKGRLDGPPDEEQRLQYRAWLRRWLDLPGDITVPEFDETIEDVVAAWLLPFEPEAFDGVYTCQPVTMQYVAILDAIRQLAYLRFVFWNDGAVDMDCDHVVSQETQRDLDESSDMRSLLFRSAALARKIRDRHVMPDQQWANEKAAENAS